MSKILVSGLLFLFLSLPVFVRADEFSSLQQQLLLLIQQVTSLQSNLNNLQRISQIPCKTLERNLGLNDSGEDVVFLQSSLEKEGFQVGLEKKNRVYGELTASAVTGFQQKYKSEILTPVGLQFGTGFVGKATRAKLNSIYACGAKAPDLSNQPIIRAPQAITVSDPSAGETVTGTVRISGTINSDGWITPSGDLGTVTVFDSTERKLSQANLMGKGDKNVLPFSFTASVSAPSPRTENGFLSFVSRSTSSVLAANAKEFRVPIKFSKPVTGSIQILFPTADQQLIGGRSYTFTWSGATGKVSLMIISNGIELFGGKAVVWRVDNIQNAGSYTAVLPPGLSGTHRLYVSDAGRFGLSRPFSISPGGSGNGQQPRISGVQGDKSLQVKQPGTWNVGASDPEGGRLDFSVDWGDGSSGKPGVSGGTGLQSAVFTHTYNINGTYTQIYRVTDPNGLSDQYSHVVQVGSVSAPTITSIVPSSGPVGTTVTITGTRFNASNNTIHFGTGQLTGVPSTNGGKTIQFKVQQDQVGSYDISVLSGSGRTNTVSFSVIPLPTCSHLNSQGTNQFLGCFWKWRSTTTVPGAPDDGILAGEAIPAQPGFLAPVPANATALDINWGSAIPGNSFTGVDQYSARWKGNFTFSPGTYRFISASKGGERVFFDGVLKADHWAQGGYAEHQFDMTFPVSTTVNIQIDYYAGGGDANVKFRWTKL